MPTSADLSENRMEPDGSPKGACEVAYAGAGEVLGGASGHASGEVFGDTSATLKLGQAEDQAHGGIRLSGCCFY